MSLPELPLPVVTLVSNAVDPTPRASWKKWNFEFEIFTTRDEGRIQTRIEDSDDVLDIEEAPVVSSSKRLEWFLENAAFLEERWTGYSNRKTDALHSPRDLATIGYELFSALFPVDENEEHALANQIVEQIRSAITAWISKFQPTHDPSTFAPALQLNFHSHDLHLPWNLLYPFESFDEHGERGFLGMSCSIEDLSPFLERPRKVNKAKWGARLPVGVSLQLDLGLRPETHSPLQNYLAGYGKDHIRVSERIKSSEFLDALRQQNVSEEIMYFCCHTNQRPVQLRLTDTQAISTDQLEKLTYKADLKQWPVIFLNTCRGTLSQNSRYRTSFVKAFFFGGAVAVVGAEAEIDQAYAGHFAEEFFTRLFSVGEIPESLGDVAYRTRLALIDKALPLSGLLYSVYSRRPVRFERLDQERVQPNKANALGSPGASANG